jgi:hypothetical protein
MLNTLREIHHPTDSDHDDISPRRPIMLHNDSQEALLPRASTASDSSQTYGAAPSHPQEDEAAVEESLKSTSPSEIAPQTLETEDSGTGAKNGKSKGKKGKKPKQLSLA